MHEPCHVCKPDLLPFEVDEGQEELSVSCSPLTDIGNPDAGWSSSNIDVPALDK